VNLDDFFVVVCTGFHEVMVCTRYVPFPKLEDKSEKVDACSTPTGNNTV